jgi:hypothetical protein
MKEFYKKTNELLGCLLVSNIMTLDSTTWTLLLIVVENLVSIG